MAIINMNPRGTGKFIGLLEKKLTEFIFDMGYQAKQLLSQAISCMVLCSCLATTLSAAPLTGIEQRLVEHIDKEQDRSLSLLEKVVNINSGTMNFAGVKTVGEVFEKELQAIGFATQWIDGAPFNRAGHLFASYGREGPKILLLGHLDTVFNADSDMQTFKRLSQDKALGPGIIDMKGGNVIIVQVLRSLHAAGMLDKYRFRVLLTGDEESRGEPMDLATQALIEAGDWADVALGFEDGDGDPATAVVSRRGSTSWRLTVKGEAAHSSQIFQPHVGDGAIFEAARILDNFREQLRPMPNLTLSPGLFVGGTKVETDEEGTSGNAAGKTNVVPRLVQITGDIRALSPEQLMQAKTAMQRIVGQNLNLTSAELSFDAGYPPMPASTGNSRLLSLYSQASQDLGFGEVVAVNPRNAGAADISFVAGYVQMAMDGLGLMGSGGHTNNETADLGTLASQAKRAALLIIRLAPE